MQKLRGNTHATSNHKTHAMQPEVPDVPLTSDGDSSRTSDRPRRGRVKTAARIALVVALTYILTASNVLSPLGMALARAYATGTPLISTSTEQDTRMAEDADANAADAAGSDDAAVASAGTEEASDQSKNAITPPREK